MTPSERGARLRCVFQRLDGEATREGLWLTSTVTNTTADRFQVKAAQVGRNHSLVAVDVSPLHLNSLEVRADSCRLLPTGTISMDGQTVRFTRPGLVEEYTVSMDGVRQDFVVLEKPGGSSSGRESAPSESGGKLEPTHVGCYRGKGELRLELSVSGAVVEPAAGGAQLVLENSGRKIAYSRLRVTDANGKELPARIEVASGILPDVEGGHPAARKESRVNGSELDFPDSLEVPSVCSAGLEAPALRQAGMPAATSLAVLVNDADAVYPVRIDPTFSDANWVSMGGLPGANGVVAALVLDGSGNLYIGGSFTIVGNIFATNIAKWNGSSWQALGSGLNSQVNALAVSGSDVYAGGYFTTAGGTDASRIAKWNGSSWSALGTGMSDGVNALAVSGSDVYAGGDFTTAGGTNANRIAKWNGSSWSALGSGMNSDCAMRWRCRAVTCMRGGGFTTAGGSAANCIAKWNGSSWSALAGGLNSAVFSLAVSGGDLYVGGTFTRATNAGPVAVAAGWVAKWNGSIWSSLGAGIEGAVRTMTVVGGDLYIGGSFTVPGGSVASRVAKWNGSTWSALGSGMDNDVLALAASGTNLFVGGNFTMAGGTTAYHLSAWNGSGWATLAEGFDAQIYALAMSGGNLYAGGDFTFAGASGASRVAKWNGSSWSALGVGFNNRVKALAVFGADLFAGGYFKTATNTGGSAVTVNYVARWNGTNWSAFGSAMNNSVSALVASGSGVYAGGNFYWATNSGGAALIVNNVAEWNGSSWSALGAGIDGSVEALAVSGSDLYAGGFFVTAGGTNANRIAKWNGNSWSALGSGLNSQVNALAVSGSDVYAGGHFTTAGGTNANRIARWNGSSWSALGGGLVGTFDSVTAVAVSGSNVYMGGHIGDSDEQWWRGSHS